MVRQSRASRRSQSGNSRCSTTHRDLKDLVAPAGNRLERLKGDRAGRHSIRINDQWRICFVWMPDDPHDAELSLREVTP
ncbi:MAG: type II toxin-antitoxin system RelE/ParE family toxin [Nitrospira sp.]|nr:type II toxin-antitoxin system RelE/ParE family toxin [Nitrospira sp.]